MAVKSNKQKLGRARDGSSSVRSYKLEAMSYGRDKAQLFLRVKRGNDESVHAYLIRGLEDKEGFSWGRVSRVSDLIKAHASSWSPEQRVKVGEQLLVWIGVFRSFKLEPVPTACSTVRCLINCGVSLEQLTPLIRGVREVLSDAELKGAETARSYSIGLRLLVDLSEDQELVKELAEKLQTFVAGSQAIDAPDILGEIMGAMNRAVVSVEALSALIDRTNIAIDQTMSGKRSTTLESARSVAVGVEALFEVGETEELDRWSKYLTDVSTRQSASTIANRSGVELNRLVQCVTTLKRIGPLEPVEEVVMALQRLSDQILERYTELQFDEERFLAAMSSLDALLSGADPQVSIKREQLTGAPAEKPAVVVIVEESIRSHHKGGSLKEARRFAEVILTLASIPEMRSHLREAGDALFVYVDSLKDYTSLEGAAHHSIVVEALLASGVEADQLHSHTERIDNVLAQRATLGDAKIGHFGRCLRTLTRIGFGDVESHGRYLLTAVGPFDSPKVGVYGRALLALDAAGLDAQELDEAVTGIVRRLVTFKLSSLGQPNLDRMERFAWGLQGLAVVKPGHKAIPQLCESLAAALEVVRVATPHDQRQFLNCVLALTVAGYRDGVDDLVARAQPGQLRSSLDIFDQMEPRVLEPSQLQQIMNPALITLNLIAEQLEISVDEFYQIPSDAIFSLRFDLRRFSSDSNRKIDVIVQHVKQFIGDSSGTVEERLQAALNAHIEERRANSEGELSASEIEAFWQALEGVSEEFVSTIVKAITPDEARTLAAYANSPIVSPPHGSVLLDIAVRAGALNR